MGELQKRIESLINNSVLFGLVKNSGRHSDQTFTVRYHQSINHGAILPLVLGSYYLENGIAKVKIRIKPSWITYILTGTLLILMLFTIFNPDMEINGTHEAFLGRFLACTLLIGVFTSVIILYSYIMFTYVRSLTELRLGLSQEMGV